MDGLIRSLNGFHKLGEEIVFLELLRLHSPRRFFVCNVMALEILPVAELFGRRCPFYRCSRFGQG